MNAALLLFALAAVTLPAGDTAPDCWIVCDAQGSYAIGYSSGGTSTLTCTVFVSRRSTWAGLRAFEGVP